MKAVSIYLYSILACALLIMQPSETQAAGDAQKIVDAVRKEVRSLKTLSCAFEQHYEWKVFDRNRTIAGTIELKNPSRIRVEYPAQTIVADGKTVWQHVTKTNRVQISGFVEGEGMFPTPHNIFLRYASRGKAVYEDEETVGGRSCDRIRIETGTGNNTSVIIWIDKKLRFPLKTVQTQKNGDVITYVLSKVKLNGKISDDRFSFEIPDGADVLDLRD